MARFRQGKSHLASICSGDNWKNLLEQNIENAAAARMYVNPLLSLLTRPEFRWQAAFGLGRAVSIIAEDAMEPARILMRRLMWSMNEESGNVGWGIPEAMGCILAESKSLAREYSRVFLSYGYNTGREDNFVDHAPLRCGVYWGIGRLAMSLPELAAPALPHLVTALQDEDRQASGMAAWAFAQLAEHIHAAAFTQAEERRKWEQAASILASLTGGEPMEIFESVEIFDGANILSIEIGSLRARALATVKSCLDADSL